MCKVLLLTVLLLVRGLSPLRGQSECTVTHFDELSGVDMWRVTQIVQDRQGMIWVSSWNGLYRYDGYQFDSFKSRPGDGVVMPSDRIRDIMLDTDGNLLCKIDEHALLFNVSTCKFMALSDKREKETLALFNQRVQNANSTRDYMEIDDPYGLPWRILRNGQLLRMDRTRGQYVRYPSDLQPLAYLRYGITDRQGNVWLRSGNGLFRLTFSQKHYQEIRQEKPTRVRTFCLDSRQRYWVTTNDDATVRIYDKSNRLLGYLDRNGSIRPDYVSFGSSIYHIMQDSQGIIWMCSKPDGLFRLRETGESRFTVEQFLHDDANTASLGGNQLYGMAEDRMGRLWVASLDNGLQCIGNPKAKILSFAHRENGLHQPDNGSPLHIRQLCITKKGILIGATTAGLLVGDVNAKDLHAVKFRLHQREANRSASLSNNAVIYAMEDSKGRLFVCTESGGLNQLMSKNLLGEHLDFKHFNMLTGLPSDITMSVIEDKKSLVVVSNNMLIRFDPDNNISVGFDLHFWRQPFRFTDAVPIRLPDGKWLFGHHQGAFTMNLDDLHKSNMVPPLAFTSLSVQNENPDKAVNSLDTLTLVPPNRNMTLFFSALDYSDGGDILYAFQMGENNQWIDLGKNRSVSFLDMEPGTYHLKIRSTNSDGIWVDNARMLTIIVKPTFWETPWATLLYILLFGAVVYGIYRTRRHIIHLRKQQRELQEAYLSLLGDQDKSEERPADNPPPVEVPKLKPEDEAFMQRAIKFIEEHIGDSDINIGDMAEATATSRSGLHRKMKSLLGVTPLDFIREARIRKACQMLRAGETVHDVAYACGFSNPKYFQKCFKDWTGKTPTEFKES